MSHVHGGLTAAGARMAGVSVDTTARNAAMVEKLHLAFPLLADPGGEAAIKPYGLWNDRERGGISQVAVILVDPDGHEAFRFVGRDYADRPTEDEFLEAVGRLGLDPVTQEPPEPGNPEPGPDAISLSALPIYFRGAKFAAAAFGKRFPEAREDARRYTEEMDRYRAAVRALLD